MCTNRPGAFECSCAAGYYMDDNGITCVSQTSGII